MVDLFDVVLTKHTGSPKQETFYDVETSANETRIVGGYSTEVNAIAFKTVDSATYLDSIDAMNYPVRAPYATNNIKQFNYTDKLEYDVDSGPVKSGVYNNSFENWVKIKLRFDRKYRKCIDGTRLFVPCACGNPDAPPEYYTKIKNLKIWVHFKNTEGYLIKYGFAEDFQKPVRVNSKIALSDIRSIGSNRYEDSIAIELPFPNNTEILLGHVESLESNFFVTQLKAFKGCEFENNLMWFEVHYDLA